MFNKRMIFTVVFFLFAVLIMVYGAGFFSVNCFVSPNNQSQWLNITTIDLDKTDTITFEGKETKVVTLALRETEVIYSTTLGALVRLDSGRFPGSFFLRESSGCPT